MAEASNTGSTALPRVSSGKYMRASKAIKAKDKSKTDSREAGIREIFAAWGKPDPEFSTETPKSKSGKPVVSCCCLSLLLVLETGMDGECPVQIREIAHLALLDISCAILPILKHVGLQLAGGLGSTWPPHAMRHSALEHASDVLRISCQPRMVLHRWH